MRLLLKNHLISRIELANAVNGLADGVLRPSTKGSPATVGGPRVGEVRLPQPQAEFRRRTLSLGEINTLKPSGIIIPTAGDVTPKLSKKEDLAGPGLGYDWAVSDQQSATKRLSAPLPGLADR